MKAQLNEILKQLRNMSQGIHGTADKERNKENLINIMWQIGDELDDLAIELSELIEGIDEGNN